LIGTTPTNAAALALTGTNISGDETRRISQNLVTATKETSWGLSAQADIDLDGVSLTSITSFRKWDNDEIRDGDWLNGPFVGLNQLHDRGPQVSNTFSQEVRLASQGSNTIDYVAGLYYSRAYSQRIFARQVITCSASTLPAVVAGLTPCSTTPGASTLTFPAGATDYGSIFKNMAAFGQVTWNVSDAFRLIGGLRYTADQLNGNIIRRTSLAGPGIQPNFDAGVFNNGQLNANGIGFLAGPSNGVPLKLKTTNDNWSGKAAAQFDLSEDNMAYASYTRGYKGPAYNLFFNLTTVGAGVIAPETVNAYEIGLKNTFLDGDLIFNLAGYYAKYKNYQANNPDLVAGQVVSRLTNAGSVSTRGVELDLLYRPSRAFTLSGGVAYTDAKVDQFRLPPGGNPANLIASGTPLANAPKWKASLAADYDLALSDALDIELGAGFAYQSSQLYQLDPSPVVRAATTVPGYSIVDLRAGIASSDDAWKLTFQVKNLFDKSFASSIVSGGPGGSYRYIIPREADRYFGATLLVKFGDER
jgi:iron complex outermembrane recepter protein